MKLAAGQRCIIVGKTRFAGRTVTLLCQPGPYGFILPDGYPHEPGHEDRWLFRTDEYPFDAPTRDPAKNRETIYGVGSAAYLHPINDLHESESP